MCTHTSEKPAKTPLLVLLVYTRDAFLVFFFICFQELGVPSLEAFKAGVDKTLSNHV